MALSRWQRAGVVASVLWGIGGGFWGLTIGAKEGNWILESYSRCFLASDDPKLANVPPAEIYDRVKEHHDKI
jgi:hypothetical protein